MVKLRYIVVLLSILFLFQAHYNDIQIKYPAYFPEPLYSFEKNKLDTSVISLGRRLFYDPIFSSDSSISCANCHSPFSAFAHTDHALSHGINDSIGHRNAPGLFNLAWQKNFMWDGAVHHLDMQPLSPIHSSIEMNETLAHIIEKLSKNEKYTTLFANCFHDSIIKSEYILKSLAQFQLTLISYNAKYDLVKQNKTDFNEKEKRGYNIFKQNCNHCHQEPLFSNYKFANNGIGLDPDLKDIGRQKITKLKEDSLLFKIPSLRNIGFTYPYMHDGRFKTLKEVIDHYCDHIEISPTTDLFLNKKINLSKNERVELVSFLHTLNDTSFVFNKKHHYPN